MMNFKDFCWLFESVAMEAPPSTGELNIIQAIKIVENACKATFGMIPGTQVTSRIINDGSIHNGSSHYLHGSGLVSIKTQTRNIALYVRQKTANYVLSHLSSDHDLIEVEVEFSWNYNQQIAASPKDHATSFSISRELNSETMPALKAFKQLFLNLRKYPMVISFVAISGNPSDPSATVDPNRRGNLYSKVLQASGYTQYEDGIWTPPGMAHYY